MNLKVLISGIVLELSYLIYLGLTSLTEMGSFYMEISPRVLELAKHTWFQAIVLIILLIGAFLNGKDKNGKDNKLKSKNNKKKK